MSGDIATQLKGSRQDVEAARKTVEARLREIAGGNRGKGDASYALRYELSVLRHICFAVKENLHQNADIYCDIVGAMLPHVAPFAEKPSLWEAHLTSLRYIHHGFCQEKSVAACQKLYGLIRSQTCRLQEESDHKIYLDIHLTHFNGIHLQLQKQTLPLEATNQLCLALEALGELFRVMREKKITKTGPLLVQLNEALFGKRSRSFFKSLSFLPSGSLPKMLDPLMRLLGSSAPGDLSSQFAEYLSFCLALFQIDMLNPLPNQQMALQLLRMCKDLFQPETNLSYGFKLLYYYLKLVYTSESSPDLKRTYVDICRKFANFFELKAASHAKEQWFTDLMIAFQRFQTLIHQSGSKTASPFQLFWQQLEGEKSPEAYEGHFQLLHSCAGLAVNVTRSPLGSSCPNEACKSQRRHCILSFGLCALDAYINWQPTQEQRADKSPHKPLLGIIIYSMDMVKSLQCMGPSSLELIKLVRQLTHVADQVSCAEQMSLLIPLLEPLQRLRPLIADQEMNSLLRRLFKASCHCKDPKMALRLQACYLASLTNPARLRSQICLHYHNQGKEDRVIQKCVYEWHESCPLPYPLTPAQKKQLYETDLFAVLHYLRGPSLEHLQSLIRCRMSDYHLVLLARQLRNDSSTLGELQELIARLENQSPLKRMDHLSLGHAKVGLLLDALEAQKTKVSSKETSENLLEELLVRQNMCEINIQREQRLVKLASQAIAGFVNFFNQADREPISSEETLIDWEALIDDAVASAMALSSMGYQSQADDAWLLLLRIGRLLEDRFTYLRALTHFLTLNAVPERLELNILKEVDLAEDLLDDLWPHLQSGRFFKRQHTTVMLCLCHLASYYSRKDCLNTAQLLLLQVEQLRDEFPERLGKSDIVLITLQTVRFRLGYLQRRPRNPRMPTPLRQLDTLLDNVRNFFNLSSLDAGSLQLLLSTLVRESTECSTNRLSERLAFSNIVLHLVLQSGFALRAIEVFLAWLWTNLQMENLDRAQCKLRLVEHCLAIKPLSQKPVSLEKVEIKESAVSDLASNMLLMQLVEPIRKQQQLEVATPRVLNLRPNSPSSQLDLNRYISLKEAPSILRENSQLKCLYFILGCLHARLCFLQRNSDQLDEFYERAESWLQENPELTDSLGSMLQVQQMYQVNYLRSRRKHVEAITLAQKGIKMQEQAMDINYGYNLMAQLKSTQLEQKPLKQQTKIIRRALLFNQSPEQKLQTPARALKAEKAPKFRIYKELELRPPSAGSSGSGIENTPPSDQVDLNACQPIEISDDESASTLPLKSKESQAKPKAKTKTTTKTKVSEIIEIVDTMETPTVAASGRSTRARIRQNEETPKTVILSSRRPRRKVPEVAPETEPLSSRRRPRN
ncbi:hypothetical protein KR009_006382 [Drosophila setifemur]|nr:hypothetical protein KR009_006382 [Drosophila setifemur]